MLRVKMYGEKVICLPRGARRKSIAGIYHVILRGINRQAIFSDDEDNGQFIQILSEYKEVCGYKLYGYCLMGNHAHLLIGEGEEPLEKIFRRIGPKYVSWFNWKYRRCGHLFQDRYKSEPVESDSYFLAALRYMHRNPVKGGLCGEPGAYRWSSYRDYLNGSGIADTGFALGLMGLEEFVRYMNRPGEDEGMETEGPRRLTDEELSKLILKKMNMQAMTIQNQPPDSRDMILRKVMKLEGVSTRQLAWVTGIPVHTIWGL